MASKPKQSQPASKRKPRKAIQCAAGTTGEETERNFAALITSPELAAYRVINGAEAKSGLSDQIDVPYLMAQLRTQADAANRGDLGYTEALLINQAIALQSLFARLAERGMSCTDAGPFEVNMRISLRAQSQCRATLETLAAIKNPPVVIATQANIAQGPQQINKGVPSASASRAQRNEPNRTEYWRRSMANGWTPERRARQAEAIRGWRPWERSTGPQTIQDKARVSRNAFKGGQRHLLREGVARLLRRCTPG